MTLELGDEILRLSEHLTFANVYPYLDCRISSMLLQKCRDTFGIILRFSNDVMGVWSAWNGLIF